MKKLIDPYILMDDFTLAFEKKASLFPEDVEEIIKEQVLIPSVNARFGKWKETKNLKGETIYECSVCGGIGHYDNFCPVCGADMNGGEGDD